jgi:hypothetical protein
MRSQQIANEVKIADVTDDQLGSSRKRPFKPGRKIVKHDHAVASIKQGEHGVTADVTSPARHQNSSRVRHPGPMIPEATKIDILIFQYPIHGGIRLGTTGIAGKGNAAVARATAALSA